MNDLLKYFSNNKGHLMDKWMHYFEIYDRHFSRFRGTDVHLVEFGVFQGGSLQMWKEYLGPKAKIYGVDINPDCKQLEEDQIEIIIGDQEDREFLQSIVKSVPKIDILIDDGGHTMAQQIHTFEEMFYFIEQYGVYMCEDLHTSYWEDHEGGYKRDGSFIEFSKNHIDYLNAWHSRDPELVVSDFTRTVHSMHYYDSVLVIEKRPIEKPHSSRTGTPKVMSFFEK